MRALAWVPRVPLLPIPVPVRAVASHTVRDTVKVAVKDNTPSTRTVQATNTALLATIGSKLSVGLNNTLTSLSNSMVSNETQPSTQSMIATSAAVRVSAGLSSTVSTYLDFLTGTPSVGSFTGGLTQHK